MSELNIIKNIQNSEIPCGEINRLPTFSENPLVSVCLITYNQEPYIAQAIESVLSQRTDFGIRLLIGDDYSLDNTQVIIRKYAETYPDRIVTILHSKNVGAVGTESVARKVLDRCTTKYIATLDGDDYWSDQYKLQKQIDFLQAHPRCTICFHDVRVTYEDKDIPPHIMSPRKRKAIYTIKDLLRKNFINTSSVVFRGGLMPIYPDFFNNLVMGDWPLWLICADKGDIGYINKAMSVYRVHNKGIWSSGERINRHQAHIDCLLGIDGYLNYRYKRIIKKTISFHELKIAQALCENGNIIAGQKALKESFKYCLINNHFPLNDLMSVILQLYFNKIFNLLRTYYRKFKKS